MPATRFCLRLAALLYVILLAAPLRGQTTQPVSLNINSTSRFQTIEGFGTALYWATPVWVPQTLTMYTQDLGATIMRVALDPNILPNQITLGPDLQSNINLFNFQGYFPQSNWGVFANQAVAATNGQMKMIASIWSPPAWMKTNNNQNGGNLIQTPANLTQFARYVAAYVQGFKEVYGVPLYAVSIQNELRFWEPYPSTVYSPSQYVAALDAVGAEFARDGITTKIMGPEDVGVDGGFLTSQQMSFINAAKSDPGGAANYLGFYAVHGYSGNGVSPGSGEAAWADYYSKIAADGKESWMTETSGENPAWVSFDSNGKPNGALSVALNMHAALAYGNVNAYVYWQMDDGKTPVSTTTLESGLDPSSLKYDAAKHYMHFIRPGAVRIAASPDTITGISVDAFIEPDNTMTVELINASNYDTPTTIAVPGTNYTSFAEYLTTALQPWAVLPDLNVSANSLSLTVPANSVITLQSDGFSLTAPEPSLALMAMPLGLLTLRRRRSC